PKRSAGEVNAPISQRMEQSGNLFEAFETPQTLQQERHSYNMEGFFSPHNLPTKNSQNDFIWIESYFLKEVDNSWYAFSAPKLLQAFVEERMLKESNTIPLLVSEPFKSKGVSEEVLKKLSHAGAEIEFLGAETLVLRGIPEWMNGFPLHEIISRILESRDFKDYQINKEDWAQSTWEEMLESFPLPELLNRKIAQNLIHLLQEKLK